MAIETKISTHSSWIDVKKKQKIISNTYGHFYFCNLSLAWYIKDSYIMIHVKDFADQQTELFHHHRSVTNDEQTFKEVIVFVII